MSCPTNWVRASWPWTWWTLNWSLMCILLKSPVRSGPVPSAIRPMIFPGSSAIVSPRSCLLNISGGRMLYQPFAFQRSLILRAEVRVFFWACSAMRAARRRRGYITLFGRVLLRPMVGVTIKPARTDFGDVPHVSNRPDPLRMRWGCRARVRAVCGARRRAGDFVHRRISRARSPAPRGCSRLPLHLPERGRLPRRGAGADFLERHARTGHPSLPDDSLLHRQRSHVPVPDHSRLLPDGTGDVVVVRPVPERHRDAVATLRGRGGREPGLRGGCVGLGGHLHAAVPVSPQPGGRGRGRATRLAAR